jgi:hypothetical protein
MKKAARMIGLNALSKLEIRALLDISEGRTGNAFQDS